MLILKPITDFHSVGAEFLSNFFGVDGTSVEHKYQAAKTISDEWQEKILNAKSPGEAKRLGRLCPVRGDWDQIKLAKMEEFLKWKFSFPQLRKALLETGDRELIEGNTWGDTFWGMVKQEDDSWEGQNNLGKLLMKLREEFRKEDI